MAAAERFQGKPTETVKLSYSPAHPGALSWSLDDRISVITGQGVYVLTPISSVRSGLNLEKTFIPNPTSAKRWTMDVAVDRKMITAETKCSEFEWCFDPQVNTPLLDLESNSFEKVAWSPLNCDKNGRCVIATLFSDHQLCIYLSPTLGINWSEAINMTQVLSAYVSSNNFKIDQDVMQSDVQEQHQQSQISNNGFPNNSHYAEFTQQRQILSLTSLHWFSEIFHTERKTSSTEAGNPVDNNQFAVLVTGNQSGHVIFWKVALPITMNSPGVELGGFLNTHQLWPCSLSWQNIANSQGLLAVGSTDGFVKVFSIRVLPSITGIAQYVLWGDKDDMQVQWLEWMPSSHAINSSYRLVICKGYSVILFSMSVKDGMLSQKPTQRIITEVHRLPITGLACACSGAIFTCSLDGSVQMLAGDEIPVKTIGYNAKKSTLCNGIGVSCNAAFIALYLSPSNYTLQFLEPHQTQILFVNIACASSAITELLNSKHVQIGNKWDVCKAVQFFTNHGKNLTEEIHQLVSTDDLDALSCAQLIIRQHVLSLMVLMSSQDESNSSTTQRSDWSSLLESTSKYVYRQLATALLRNWLEVRQSGTVNQSDSLSALLVCDWLVTKFSDSAMLDLVTTVYQACNDSEGLAMVSSLQAQCYGSVKNVFSSKSSSNAPQMTTQGANSEAENNEEPVAEPMDTNQDPTQVDAAVVEGGSGGKTVVSFPAREKCPLCESAIPVDSLGYGTCLNGHKLQRCCVSFTVCADFSLKRCQDCSRCVSMPHPGSSSWMHNLLLSKTKCPFCLGFFCAFS